MGGSTPQLRQWQLLGRMLGLQLSYRDIRGKQHLATTETIHWASHTLLAQMGFSGLAGTGDVQQALAFMRERHYQQWVSPVQVSWGKYVPGVVEKIAVSFRLRLPAKVVGQRMQLSLCPQELLISQSTAAIWQEEISLAQKNPLRKIQERGESFYLYEIPLSQKLAFGFYQVELQFQQQSPCIQQKFLWIVAPEHSYQGESFNSTTPWVGFMPLYSLLSANSQGIGDFHDLRQLQEWVENMGGVGLGTLPMLMSTKPPGQNQLDPSPYSPSSRLFWNEIYLNIWQIEHWQRIPTIMQTLSSSDANLDLLQLNRDTRQSRRVDYEKVRSIKASFLSHAANWILLGAQKGEVALSEQGKKILNQEQIEDLQQFVQKTPHLWEMAQFQSSTQKEFPPQYYIYVQWLCHRQWRDLHNMYLDYPVGVNPQGFDAQEFADTFIHGGGPGAPPDPFFWEGQNWNLLLQHPHNARKLGWTYLRETLSFHMQQARWLRIDHLQGIHRIFWIPEGASARQGIYLSYDYGEIYACLTLLSHKYQCVVIGEDLGTVPPNVPLQMDRHKIWGMSILPFEMENLSIMPAALPSAQRPLQVLAALNTHDMPTFAQFWEQKTNVHKKWIEILQEEKLLAPVFSLVELLRASLVFLLQGKGEKYGLPKGHLVQINLEDLWLETLPQNIPGQPSTPAGAGAATEAPGNWQRLARLSLEEILNASEIKEFLQELRGV